MKIKILTIFKDFYNEFLSSSIIKRAISKNIVSFEVINIRDFSLDKNHRIDDHPISGGAGLIMRLEPLVAALNSTATDKSYKILLGPKGKKYDQKKAIELSQKEEIILICGHYEGVDSRFKNYVDEEISIGDFILTGGEIAAMAIADSITRLLKGAIREESTQEESFTNSFLEYKQYTYPYEYDGEKIPDILFCGNHQIIKKYHKKDALKETIKYRPDLLKNCFYDKEDAIIYKNRFSLDQLDDEELLAIEKGHKFKKG